VKTRPRLEGRWPKPVRTLCRYWRE
jgi:hypothetical protein